MLENDQISQPMKDVALASEVARLLIEKNFTLATAESCTGGAIGALLTTLPGSSSWFNGGIISYSNAAKTSLLGVGSDIIEKYGAVSQEVVEAMAKGGRAAFTADISVAVSGVAGPGGGTHDKPVGYVWVAWCSGKGELTSQLFYFDGERSQVQKQAVREALKGVKVTLIGAHKD